jgi:uncharacterized protein
MIERENPLVFDIKGLISGSEAIIEVTDIVIDDTTWIGEKGQFGKLKLSLSIENTNNGILVTLIDLLAKVTQECSSCLTEFKRSISLDKVTALYELKDDESQVVPEEYKKGLSLSKQTLDTRLLIRDNMLLALTSNSKCKLDCLGLCQSCGANNNVEDCKCPADHQDSSKPLSELSKLWNEEINKTK